MDLVFAPSEIETWPIEKLRPYARNAKMHGRDQVPAQRRGELAAGTSAAMHHKESRWPEMSGDRTSAEIATASIPAPACGIRTLICRAAQSQWRQERLNEARGILADIAQHPDTLVVLACRVVCGCSPDAKERADALGVMRLLSARPSERASAALKGGVA